MVFFALCFHRYSEAWDAGGCHTADLQEDGF